MGEKKWREGKSLEKRVREREKERMREHLREGSGSDCEGIGEGARSYAVTCGALWLCVRRI